MEDKVDKQMSKYKTLCCKDKWYRKGRADYHCVKCDKDVTLELALLRQALEK